MFAYFILIILFILTLKVKKNIVWVKSYFYFLYNKINLQIVVKCTIFIITMFCSVAMHFITQIMAYNYDEFQSYQSICLLLFYGI